MNFLKKYLGDPDVIEHLDFERAIPYEFDLDGQKMKFISPDYACEIPPRSSSAHVRLGESFWKTEHSTIGPYQYLFGNICSVYNQKLFNKEYRGCLKLSIILRYRPHGSSLSSVKALSQHTSFVIAEHLRKYGGGMINRQRDKWTHEVDYSHDENEFMLLEKNGINWLCGYKLSEGFIENSFYHTLLNESVIIELKLSRRIGGGTTTHEMQPDIINALNAAERDFLRHFKLEPNENTLAVQSMLAEQFKGKVLTLDDISGSSERALLNN